MKDCHATATEHIPHSVLSFKDAEAQISSILNSGDNPGVSALISVELDDLPYGDMACLAIEKKADVTLLRIFPERCIIARSSSSIIVFAYGIKSRALARLQLEQLPGLLRFAFEENGSVEQTSCAAGIVLWDHSASAFSYEWLKNATTSALGRQRQRDLNGFIILEAGPDGIFLESPSKLPPEQIFDRISVGVLLLQGLCQRRCIYHNGSVARLLGVRDDCDGMEAHELFALLREQDRVTLEAMLAGVADTPNYSEITVKTLGGSWLMIRMLSVLARDDAAPQLLLSLYDITGIKESDAEAKLAKKKLEVISDTTLMPTFEVDIATRTLTLSPSIPRLYYCRSTVVRDAPDACLKCCECMQRSSLDAYCSMFDDIYAGKSDGAIYVNVRSRLTDDYLPVRFTWKSVPDDHGRPAKAIGVVDPVLNVRRNDDEETIAELRAKLSLEERYFRRSEEYLRALRKYRHDSKNYVIALTGFIKEGKTQEALDFLGRIGAQLRAGTPLVNTGNVAIDAIISEKLQLAIISGVNVNQIVGLPPRLKFDMMDLCLAVASCLDNAIEAVSKVLAAGDKAFIDFQLVERKNVIVMKLSNSFIPPADGGDPEGKTTRADKLNHGFGLQSVRSIVNRHNGNLVISRSENVYTTAFTLFV